VKTWEDHPFVQRAARLAEEAGEPSTLRVLEELFGIMYEVEDRFPGVPFSDVLQDQAQAKGWDLVRIRRTLAKNGACQADIALVAPASDDPGLMARRAQIQSDPYQPEAERL
jgi:hypothetical protein